MSAPTAPVESQRKDSPLVAGQAIGGRFQFERHLTKDALGDVVAALDLSSNKPVALRMVARHLTKDAGAAQLLVNEVKLAASLSHRGIVRTFGMGQDPVADWFIACERIDGHALSDIIAKRRAENLGGISLRGAYNVIAHVCSALTATQATMPHGAVRPSVIWVTEGGQVRIGDFGVGRAILKRAGAAALGATEQGYLAPEVKAGHEPTPRSDLFGVGALLYTMLTGRSPSEEFVAPSKVNSDATKEVDAILMRCLSADPAQRFASPDEVQKTLLPIVSKAPEADPNDFEFAMEIDETLAKSGRPPPRSVPPSIRPGGASAAKPSVPVVPKAPGIPKMAIPGQPQGAKASAAAATAAAGPRMSADKAFQTALETVEKNDAPRWMVTKDNMDHGPFTGRELVQAIINGEVLVTHGVFNMDTRERKDLADYAEFAPFVEQYKLREGKKQEQRALERSATVEKAGNAVKFIVAGGIVAAIAIAAGIYIATRPKQDTARVANANLADLYERGEIHLTGSAGILPVPRGGGGRSGAGRRSGSHGGAMSYEEAMSQGINIGDATREGGEQQLGRDTVAGVMNRSLNSLFSCVGAELRRGGHVGNVQIDLAIEGSGRVLGATVRTGSAAFQQCISQRTRAIHFPSFSAPRMGARYSFSVD
ncbi:MAG: serine/threonine protein kinase [Sandaracinaceae bacterium]|jgi:hypothetical protein|nr:serine/threonine protein kinase [Sandaracinaceae bacterium]